MFIRFQIEVQPYFNIRRDEAGVMSQTQAKPFAEGSEVVLGMRIPDFRRGEAEVATVVPLGCRERVGCK